MERELDAQSIPAGRRGLQGVGSGRAAGRTSLPAAHAACRCRQRAATGRGRGAPPPPPPPPPPRGKHRHGARTCLRGEGVEVCRGGHPALHIKVIAKHLGSVALQAGGRGGEESRGGKQDAGARKRIAHGGRERWESSRPPPGHSLAAFPASSEPLGQAPSPTLQHPAGGTHVESAVKVLAKAPANAPAPSGTPQHPAGRQHRAGSTHVEGAAIEVDA